MNETLCENTMVPVINGPGLSLPSQRLGSLMDVTIVEAGREREVSNGC